MPFPKQLGNGSFFIWRKKEMKYYGRYLEWCNYTDYGIDN